MKKTIYTFLTAAAILLAGCDQLLYDDSVLTERVDELEERIETLEELCAQMNTNISSLQTIVTALQEKDYVTSVVPVTKDEKVIGYTISFTKSNPITIYHGEKGDKGDTGDTGAAGHNPVIGVRQDTDGIYYWTLDGEWLTDASGNKIKAVGVDGTDGQKGADGKDGADAIAPKLKIENDHWWLSTDGGTTWADLGQAKGDAGQDGADGDSFFKNVDDTDAAVVFTLADGITTVTIPKTQPLGLVFAQTEDIMVVGGTSKTIDFTITGGTAETRVGAIASDGWRAKIVKNSDNVSGTLTITAPDTFNTDHISVWVSNSERTLFYSLVFEAGVLNVTSASSFNLTAETQTFDVTVSTNVDYTIDIPVGVDWITKVETRALRTETTTFNITANYSSASRSATLTFSCGNQIDTIGVTQAAIIFDKVDKVVKGSTYVMQGTVTALSSNGFILTDATGSIFCYQPTGTFAIGEKLTVEGEISSYNTGLQIKGSTAKITKDGTEIVTYPEPTVFDGTAIDAFIAVKTDRLATYVSMTGNVSVSGNYYNLTVEGTTNQGSVYYITDAIKALLANGDNVTLKGYAIAVSSGKYCNVIVADVIVNKKAETVSVDPTSLSWAADAVDAKTITVTASSAWTITKEGLDWATVTEDHTANTITITPTAANDGTIAKQGTITVVCGIATATVSVKQAAAGQAEVIFEDDFAWATKGGNTATSDSCPKLTTDDTSDWTFNDSAYQANGAIKLGKSGATGYIESKALDLSSAFAVTVEVKGWTTVEGTLDITVDSVTKSITYTEKISDAFGTYTVTFDAATSASKVKIATSAKRAFVSSVKITK